MARKLKVTQPTYKPVPGTNIEVPAYALDAAATLAAKIDPRKITRGLEHLSWIRRNVLGGGL